MASGSPFASQRRCSLVEKPPRERPSACPSCPPWRRRRAGGRGPRWRRAFAAAPRQHRCRPGPRTLPRTDPGHASVRSGARPCSTARTARGSPASRHPRAPATGCHPAAAGSRGSAGRAPSRATARPAPILRPSDHPEPRHSPATAKAGEPLSMTAVPTSTPPSPAKQAALEQQRHHALHRCRLQPADHARWSAGDTARTTLVVRADTASAGAGQGTRDHGHRARAGAPRPTSGRRPIQWFPLVVVEKRIFPGLGHTAASAARLPRAKVPAPR